MPYSDVHATHIFSCHFKKGQMSGIWHSKIQPNLASNKPGEYEFCALIVVLQFWT